MWGFFEDINIEYYFLSWTDNMKETNFHWRRTSDLVFELFYDCQFKRKEVIICTVKFVIQRLFMA